MKQQFSLKRFLLTLLGFFGVVIIVFGQGKINLSLNLEYFMGILFLIGTALSVSINTILGQGLVKKYGGAKTAAYFMLVGFFALLVHNIITNEISSLSKISLTDLSLSIYIGIFPTAITWLVFLSSLKVLSPSESSLFKLFIPVFTAVFSIIFLRETLTFNLIIGGLIVMSCIYLVQKDGLKMGHELD
jgi:drug/metabolite transporter (DMT)-like permease